jgi:hypothetical protein
MGEPSALVTKAEEENKDQMFQARDHTTIQGFPAHSSASSTFTSRVSNALASPKAKFIVGFAVLALIIVAWTTYRDTSAIGPLPSWTASPTSYRGQYLSQSTYLKYSSDSNRYRFAIISDMDTASAIDKTLVFKAEVKEGRLIRNKNGHYTIEWDITVRLRCYLAEIGVLDSLEGMKLTKRVVVTRLCSKRSTMRKDEAWNFLNSFITTICF